MRSGKVKVMLTMDPRIIKATDECARLAGVNRSAYVESSLRAYLARAEPAIEQRTSEPGW
jgi:hypothetical protein